MSRVKRFRNQVQRRRENALLQGCRGGDDYAVVEGILARRFPIYPDDKPESKPTGKLRQIQYKLHPGEAGWLLKVDKILEF